MADRLILASGSPRRRELLGRIGRTFEVIVPDVDEVHLPGESPEAMVLRLALAKARAVAADHPGATVVGADTVVVLDGEILGKPTDAADAADMLTRLSGRTHEVVTGVAVVPGECFATTTTVTFRTLPPAEVAGYVATGEPLDKAGAYGIQGLGGALVASISGSFDNVVGLPVEQLSDLLRPGGRRRQ